MEVGGRQGSDVEFGRNFPLHGILETSELSRTFLVISLITCVRFWVGCQFEMPVKPKPSWQNHWPKAENARPLSSINRITTAPTSGGCALLAGGASCDCVCCRRARSGGGRGQVPAKTSKGPVRAPLLSGDEILARLPVKIDPAQKAQREKLFEHMDLNGNGAPLPICSPPA